jgi:hypothetical protein
MYRGYSEGTALIGAHVAPSFKRKVVDLAHLNGQSISDLVKDALREHLLRSAAS